MGRKEHPSQRVLRLAGYRKVCGLPWWDRVRGKEKMFRATGRQIGRVLGPTGSFRGGQVFSQLSPPFLVQQLTDLRQAEQITRTSPGPPVDPRGNLKVPNSRIQMFRVPSVGSRLRTASGSSCPVPLRPRFDGKSLIEDVRLPSFDLREQTFHAVE